MIKISCLILRSICKSQNEYDSKLNTYFGKGRKHCGKRRKWWLPLCFQKPSFAGSVKSGLCGKALKKEDQDI